MGTLLGSMNGNQINITSSFAVPMKFTQNNSEGEIIIDKDYQNKMLKFYRKVNQKEGIVGLYYTTNAVTQNVTKLWSYYSTELLRDKKNKPVLTQPLLMLVDPTLQDHRMSIKVMTLVNSSPIVVFSECPFSF